MELGVHLVFFNPTGGPAALAPELARIGEASEAAGIRHLSMMDHYFQMEHVGVSEDPMLEGYTTLGYLAAHTSTIPLGVLVTGVNYRYPGLLAKIVTTLDVLSGGRAELGLGAGWYEREHKGLGVPFPSTAERFERLEETLQICLQMWDQDNNGAYEGKHYQLAETICSPPPVQSPRPPILIGGGGERKTLRLVAQYGDACNLFATSTEEVAHKLDVLRAHCADIGRDPSTIRTTITSLAQNLSQGDVDGFVEDMSGYAKLGVDTVIVVPPPGDGQAAWIDKNCAPAVRKLAEL